MRLQDIWTDRQVDRVIPIYPLKLCLQGYNKRCINNHTVRACELRNIIVTY